MDHNLFIPSKLRVGFVNDDSTFTGKLAYVIYYDEKGKIRKETSWNNWRNKTIEALELDNTPMLGYMLNRGVERYGYHGSGRSMIRVHDPRDFEFEISIDNLVGILMNNDVSKRDIQGECVFAWAGPELILLPTNSEEYKSSQRYTEKQSLKVSTKDLIQGATYVKKKDAKKTEYRYLGYFEWFDYLDDTSIRQTVSKGKKHLFYSKEQRLNKNYQAIKGVFDTVIAPLTPSLLAECISPDIDVEYPIVRKQFEESSNSAQFTGYREEIITEDDLKQLPKNSWYSSSKSFCLNYGEDTMYNLEFNMYYHNKGYYENTYEHFFNLYVMIKDGDVYKHKKIKHSHKEENATDRKYLYQIFGNKRQLSPAEFASALNENGFRKIIRTRSDGVTDTLYKD